MEAGGARVERPVERVGGFEERAHAAAGALEERRPGVHRGVVDDDVVVVEVERAEERGQIGEHCHSGDEGRKAVTRTERHSCGWYSNARSSKPTAVHQRLRALSMTTRTRTPLRSASATRQWPARPVVPVFTPIAPS